MKGSIVTSDRKLDAAETAGAQLNDNAGIINGFRNLLASQTNRLTTELEDLRTGISLSNFLWKEEKGFSRREYSQHFRRDGFGKYILKRVEVLDKISKAIDEQLVLQPCNSASVYLSGCRGMGKTSVLMLVARELKSQGFEVFWFESAQSIPIGIGKRIKDYASRNRSKKVAVFVDEVAANPNSDLFVALLKDTPPNVLTIGAAVPLFPPFSGGASFRDTMRTIDLVMNESDEDVVSLIEHWKGLNVATPEVVEFVCKFLLDHCGGHLYPVLAFMEHFFTNEEAKKHLGATREFLKYFYSQEFVSSAVYKEVCGGCFDALSLDSSSAVVAARVLSGRAEPHSDIHTLTGHGWWVPEKSNVLSALLLNVCVGVLNPRSANQLCLRQDDTPEYNLERLIVEGLYHMKEHQLVAGLRSDFWQIDNVRALSFNFACTVRAVFANAYLQFQSANNNGSVDFYANGCVNGVLKTMRDTTDIIDGTESQGSHNINKHLHECLLGKYAGRPFALLNFDMEGECESPVLPRDILEGITDADNNSVKAVTNGSKYRDNVYTYVHMTNSLYKGAKLLRAPAVAALPCLNPLVRDKSGAAGNKRGYCTAVERMGVRSVCSHRLLPSTMLPRVLLRGFASCLKQF